jgi:hypothetical protein
VREQHYKNLREGPLPQIPTADRHRGQST